MRLRARATSLGGCLVPASFIRKAIILHEHPAASHGGPVLLIDGRPVGVAEAERFRYQVVDATGTELDLLRRSAYRFDLSGSSGTAD